ncbi:MAG: sulfite exporter TauE/SafE family protein [Rhodothermaceae bacterium]|nr:sulfite exporter TauE/SafE family protein [Rhodothermaceae bacterium]
MLDLWVVFLIGLLGSAHCVGMCGGFVALLGHTASTGAARRRQAAYFSGKTATYAVMGALAGWVGGAAGIALSGFQGLLSVFLGLVLVAIGLGLCGLLHYLPGAGRVSSRVAVYLGPAVRRLVQQDRPSALFGLGAVNGLLPCGLVYGMLAKAATTGSAAGGALTLAVFGLGTVPALALVGAVGALMPPARRLWLQRAGGVLVVALGVLTLTRAAAAFGLLSPEAAPHAHTLLCLP